MCRRGRVKDLILDNGTSLIGAERELREALADINQGKTEGTAEREFEVEFQSSFRFLS